jgi:Sec-independent protein secretion pathway component TatC
MIADQFVREMNMREAKRAALLRRERSFALALVASGLVGFAIGCLIGYIYYFC